MQRKLCTVVVFFCTVLAAASLQAGITGTLSGKVFDKETGQVLPGAAIVVEGTTMGTMADKNGFYMIHNLPAGSYNVSASMIGYSKQTIQEVQINVDMNKVLNFYLSTEVLPLEEVVVTNQRELIQSDLTSSTYFVSGNEINKTLPIDSYRDAVALLPGVVGDHIRGSREGGVVYMLDGLPIQSGLSREISSYFPNSSIVEMMVQTGGFSAEYGQATSGIINVVTKGGGNKATGGFKFYTDFFNTGLTGNDNTRRLELNVGGPITVGFGGPLLHAQYFVAADLNLSDTSFRKQMRQAFDSPVFSNYNLNSKLSFDISTNTRLTFQGLVSNWRWRKFDSQWELNLSGLAEQKHFSHRFSVSLAHTFSPRLFASIRIADYSNKKEVLGSTDPSDLLFEDPADPTSRILDGKQPWWEHTKERIDIVKFDLVGQLSDHHLLKAGLDFQNYKLNSDKLTFTALPTLGNTRSLILSKNADNFDYTPQFFALYLQDHLRLKGISANLGLRYDVFSPQIVLPEPPQEFQELRTRLRAPLTETSGQTQAPISPRLGVSIPLSDNERLHVNYGWYYQMPPLYYLYANAGRSLDSYFPFVGSVDLKPIKTISTEFSYRRIVAHDLLFVLTGFTKQFENLVDTQVFVLPDSLIGAETSTAGFAKYANSASGSAAGFEVTLQKHLTPRLSGRISYTYMKARGTSSTAEDGYKVAVFGAPASRGKDFPLSWDQRHSLIVDTRYESPQVDFTVLYRLFSPLPVTTPGSAVPNDARMSWRNILDLKVSVHTKRLLHGRLKPFFELRNVFDEKNIINRRDDTGVRAYRLFDPINSDQGRRLRLGMTVDF